MRELVAEAIDIVVFLVRDPKIGPKLSELISVEGVKDGDYVFKDLRS
jgi:Flp pilus assembly CpaF family ATPase